MGKLVDLFESETVRYSAFFLIACLWAFLVGCLTAEVHAQYAKGTQPPPRLDYHKCSAARGLRIEVTKEQWNKNMQCISGCAVQRQSANSYVMTGAKCTAPQ